MSHDLSKKARSVLPSFKMKKILQFKGLFFPSRRFDVRISSNYLQLRNLTKWGHMHHVSSDRDCGELQFQEAAACLLHNQILNEYQTNKCLNYSEISPSKSTCLNLNARGLRLSLFEF